MANLLKLIKILKVLNYSSYLKLKVKNIMYDKNQPTIFSKLNHLNNIYLNKSIICYFVYFYIQNYKHFSLNKEI